MWIAVTTLIAVILPFFGNLMGFLGEQSVWIHLTMSCPIYGLDFVVPTLSQLLSWQFWVTNLYEIRRCMLSVLQIHFGRCPEVSCFVISSS